MKNKFKLTTITICSIILIIVAAYPALAHETYYFITTYSNDHDSQNHPAVVYSSDTVQNYNNAKNVDIIHKIAQRFNLNEQELRDYINQLHNEYNHNQVIDYDPENDDEDDSEELATNFDKYHGDRYSKHLNFIDQKLTQAVQSGQISNDQRRRVLDKLQHLMASEENYYNARNMTTDEKQARINSWKNDMSRWSERNGLTLAQLRDITGKGNKYLMGVDY